MSYHKKIVYKNTNWKPECDRCRVCNSKLKLLDKDYCSHFCQYILEKRCYYTPTGIEMTQTFEKVLDLFLKSRTQKITLPKNIESLIKKQHGKTTS